MQASAGRPEMRRRGGRSKDYQDVVIALIIKVLSSQRGGGDELFLTSLMNPSWTSSTDSSCTFSSGHKHKTGWVLTCWVTTRSVTFFCCDYESALQAKLDFWRLVALSGKVFMNSFPCCVCLWSTSIHIEHNSIRTKGRCDTRNWWNPFYISFFKYRYTQS